MPQSNSHIYIDTSVTPHIGIDPADVAYVLGEASGDYGVLCSSNNINKYAKYKPCGGSSPASPTEAERKQVNCGIDTTNLVFSSFGDCLTAAKANCDWSKATPIAYRLGDFDMYYHGARAPYVPQTNKKGNTSAGSGDSPYIPLAITKNDDMFNGVKVNLKVSDLLGMLEENYNLEDYKYALIFRDANDPESTIYKYDIPMGSGEVIDDSDKSFGYTFPVSAQAYNTTVTYDCVFIVYVDDDGEYEMTYLPNSFFQVQLAFFGIWNSSGTSSIDGQTFQVPATGGTFEFIFSGYEWHVEENHQEVTTQFTPSGGSSVSLYSSVQMNVLALPSESARLEGGTVTANVVVSVPGVTGTTPDFTKEFYIEQTRPVPIGPIIEFYYQGERINQLEVTTVGGTQYDIHYIYNTAWSLSRIIKEGDIEAQSTDISIYPTSRTAPSSGAPYAQFDGYVLTQTTLVAGTRYRIELSTTSGVQYLYVLVK